MPDIPLIKQDDDDDDADILNAHHLDRQIKKRGELTAEGFVVVVACHVNQIRRRKRTRHIKSLISVVE